MNNRTLDVRIRQATEADRAALPALIVRAFQDVRAHQSGEIYDRIWQDWKADLNHELELSNVIVAEVASELVGFATYELNHTTRIGTVSDNAVLPAYRGHGIGGRLLARVLDQLKEESMDFAQVSTGLDEPYASARRMYERQGFLPLHRSIHYVNKLRHSAKSQ